MGAFSPAASQDHVHDFPASGELSHPPVAATDTSRVGDPGGPPRISSPVVITGMHRSGTSYVASWFAAAGVDMGERLLAADAGNRRGYFEDLDFLSLQREMLAASTPAGEAGHPDWGWTESERLEESRFAAFRDAARALVAQRAVRPRGDGGGGAWGWKDPRASLALDFWHEVLGAEGLTPGFVLLYRFPWDVADSMHRLGAEVFLRHPDYALRVWAFYNRHLLAFRRRSPARTLLVSVNALLGDPARFSALVRDRLGLPLAAEPPAGLFAPELFTGRAGEDPLPGLVAATAPAAVALLAELDRAADLPATGLWTAARRQARAPRPPVKLSVITPCYNHGEFLVEAVASFERNAPPEAELLIVNDGSTQERTLEVLAALRGAGYRVLDQPNRGLVAARNAGIEAARGGYILPLDSDNRLRAGFMEAAIARLDADPAAGVVYGDRCEFGLRSGRVRVPEFDLDRLLTGNYIDACAVFRRQAWEQCGGYDPALTAWEDWELWIAIASRGWRFHHLESVTFDYRVRPDSMVVACQDAAVGQPLQEHIVQKHRELYLARLPALLIAVQHGRPAAVGGLMIGAAAEMETEQARAELAALRAAQAPILAEVEGLRREHQAMAAEHRALAERATELQATVEGWQTQAAGLGVERDRLYCELARWRGRLRSMEATRVWRLRHWVLKLRRRAH
jgi:hypothetical protein